MFRIFLFLFKFGFFYFLAETKIIASQLRLLLPILLNILMNIILKTFDSLRLEATMQRLILALMENM